MQQPFFFEKVISYFLLRWVFIAMSGLSLVVHGLLIAMASLLVEHRPYVHRLHQLRCTSLVALKHVGSSRTRDQTCVPCIGSQILIHCTTREVRQHPFCNTWIKE